jgi:DNA-directed RNA polymerase specialized sigma24 family protein
MADNNKEMLEYLLLIKKTTKSIRLNLFFDHDSIEDDVSHDAFIKLFESGFFTKQNHTGKNSYIYRTVKNCFFDKLKSLGVIRNLTKAEKENTVNKYENIISITMDEFIETSEPVADSVTPEGYINAKEAYQWIKSCFDTVYNEIKDLKRQSFFNSAFWWHNDKGIPVKELARFLGYETSNPTQELKRLIQKVSLCTEQYGITVTNPHEQIQFLQEQIENVEVIS